MWFARFIFLLIVMVIMGTIGYAIGERRGRPVAGAVVGFWFGPIGLVIAAFLSRSAAAESEHRRRIASADWSADNPDRDKAEFERFIRDQVLDDLAGKRDG